MKKYFIISICLIKGVVSFSQPDTCLHKSIGIQESFLFKDYGFCYNQELSKRSSYSLQLSYTFQDASAYTIYGIKGFSVNTLYEMKTKIKKNNPFIAIGIGYRYIDLDSVILTDEQSTESFAEKSNYYSIKTGWGNKYYFKKITCSFLLGIQLVRLSSIRSNASFLEWPGHYNGDAPPYPSGSTNRISSWFPYPILDFSIGYNF